MGEYTTTAHIPATEPKTGPGAGSYIVAVLIPIVGVILAIVALAKNRVGPGLALLATSALGAFVAALLLGL